MNKIKKLKIVKKPWGAEMWFAQVPGKYLGKMIHVNAGFRTSLHYHKTKEETMLVVNGILDYIQEDKTKAPAERIHYFFKLGDIVHIPPRVKHSLGAGAKDVLLVEVSTCHPADSIRVFDYLGRKCAKEK